MQTKFFQKKFPVIRMNTLIPDTYWGTHSLTPVHPHARTHPRTHTRQPQYSQEDYVKIATHVYNF